MPCFLFRRGYHLHRVVNDCGAAAATQVVQNVEREAADGADDKQPADGICPHWVSVVPVCQTGFTPEVVYQLEHKDTLQRQNNTIFP